MLKTILLIGTGGFIGSVSRYYLSKLNFLFGVLSLPVGTLAVNVLGCFFVGFLAGIADKSAILTVEWRKFLMVGFCGGFTTFSTFAGENLALLHSGEIFQIVLYTGLSILLGFLAVYFGYILTNLL